MGGSVRRFGCLCLLALGVVGLSPASAGAVTLGSHQIDQTLTDFTVGCGAPPCTYVQTRLPGAQVRAPFSGEVRKWRVVSTGTHDFQLAVLQKKRNGKYRNVGQSSIESAPAAGEYEFSASIPIHKGEFVGLMGDVMAGVDNNRGRNLLWDPGILFPNARKPTANGKAEFQFNATVRR